MSSTVVLLHGSSSDHRGNLASVVGSGHGQIRGARRREVGEGEERRLWRSPSVKLAKCTDPTGRRSMEIERRRHGGEGWPVAMERGRRNPAAVATATPGPRRRQRDPQGRPVQDLGGGKGIGG